jgi:hypothetical protein
MRCFIFFKKVSFSKQFLKTFDIFNKIVRYLSLREYKKSQVNAWDFFYFIVPPKMETLFLILNTPTFYGSVTKVGDYAKSLVNLKRKNFLSLTPLYIIRKYLIFALNDSAETLVLLLLK